MMPLERLFIPDQFRESVEIPFRPPPTLNTTIYVAILGTRPGKDLLAGGHPTNFNPPIGPIATLLPHSVLFCLPE